MQIHKEYTLTMNCVMNVVKEDTWDLSKGDTGVFLEELDHRPMEEEYLPFVLRLKERHPDLIEAISSYLLSDDEDHPVYIGVMHRYKAVFIAYQRNNLHLFSFT